MSAPPPGEIRLKVAYNNAQSLLGEFTRSVGRGAVALESGKPVPLGTRFVFELLAKGVEERLEVVGEVIHVEKAEQPGRFRIHVRYNPKGERKVVDGLLQRIFDAHKLEVMRVYPRIPLCLRASEEKPRSPTFLVRDISLGGLGMELEGGSFPRSVSIGAPCLLELWLTNGALALHGEIVWLVAAPTTSGGAEEAEGFRPKLGVRFGKLRPQTRTPLEAILKLRGLPPPPWRARVSFGLDAVSRMP